MRGRVVAEYIYQEIDGTPRYRVLRFEPKDFAQQPSDGEGGWRSGSGCMQGVELLLYRLPRVVVAADRGYSLMLAEGEKDVHALEALGLYATTTTGGAAKPIKPEWFEPAVGVKRLVLIPDNDDPGRTTGIFH